MTSPDTMRVLTENLIQYMFGSYLALATFIYIGFLITNSWNGIPLQISLITYSPLLFVFATSVWLGGTEWILTVFSIAIGLVITGILNYLYNRGR